MHYITLYVYILLYKLHDMSMRFLKQTALVFNRFFTKKKVSKNLYEIKLLKRISVWYHRTISKAIVARVSANNYFQTLKVSSWIKQILSDEST